MIEKRYNIARRILIFWTLFIGLGAVAGAIGMLVAPDGSALGMDKMLPYFQVLPFSKYLFQDFTFSGIALLCINGIPNLIAAYMLIRKHELGVMLGGIFGVTLMLWISIQFIIFECNFMSSAYFVFGFLQAATGLCAYVFGKQAALEVNEADYKNIGADPSVLVVYFSRLGRVKEIACREAQNTGGALFELRTAEHTAGTLGFWWCGRFGMHRWSMPLIDMPEDLGSYAKVIICTPIWVFRMCAPVREFCKQASGKIRNAEYVIVHFNPLNYAGAFAEMDELLNVKATRRVSVCSQMGKLKYYKEV